MSPPNEGHSDTAIRVLFDRFHKLILILEAENLELQRERDELRAIVASLGHGHDDL